MSDLHRMTEAESAALMRGIRPWVHPTLESVRNAMIGEVFLIPEAPDDSVSRRPKFFDAMPSTFREVVNAGRLFDLGHMSSKVLRQEADRAVELLATGHIGHPFREPYVLFHTWQDPVLNAQKVVGAAYLVDASIDWHKLSGGRYPPNSFLVAEAEPIMVFDQRMMMLCDAALAAIVKKPENPGCTYDGVIFRGVLNEELKSDATDTQVICNLFDPVAACLLLLATDGVTVDRIAAPEKLNKHRVRGGKPAIPAHWRVNSGPYVTAIENRGRRRSEPGDGHHASPLPHLRRGHLRHRHEMHGGGTVWVRDALVNLVNPDAPLARSFYAMQQERKETT